MNAEGGQLTILMPCLNEAETLARCIHKARGFLERTQTVGEVLVADNGSHDGSPEIAVQAGARVVAVARRGYGSAIAHGTQAARGRFVIVGDADDSYDFSRLDAFLEKLRGLRFGNGQSFRRRHRAGGNALEKPLHWQSGFERHRPRAVRLPGARFALWLARLLAGSVQSHGTEINRHGVRLRNGRASDAVAPENDRGSNHPLARRPLASAASSPLARRLAAFVVFGVEPTRLSKPNARKSAGVGPSNLAACARLC